MVEKALGQKNVTYKKLERDRNAKNMHDYHREQREATKQATLAKGTKYKELQEKFSAREERQRKIQKITKRRNKKAIARLLQKAYK